MQAAAITIARPATITVTELDLTQDASQAHLRDRHSRAAAERRIIRTVLQLEQLVRLQFALENQVIGPAWTAMVME